MLSLSPCGREEALLALSSASYTGRIMRIIDTSQVTFHLASSTWYAGLIDPLVLRLPWSSSAASNLAWLWGVIRSIGALLLKRVRSGRHGRHCKTAFQLFWLKLSRLEADCVGFDSGLRGGAIWWSFVATNLSQEPRSGSGSVDGMLSDKLTAATMRPEGHFGMGLWMLWMLWML